MREAKTDTRTEREREREGEIIFRIDVCDACNIYVIC